MHEPTNRPKGGGAEWWTASRSGSAVALDLAFRAAELKPDVILLAVELPELTVWSAFRPGVIRNWLS